MNGTAVDRFASLSLFVRVVETGSFSAASRAAGISQPTASKQIVELERHLGARLLQRTTRKLSLTEAGTRFYDHAKRLLADLAEAESSVSRLQGAAVGTLRVGAPVAFGRLHIVPELPDFLSQYPGLAVDLSLNDRFVDLIEERVDVAIRIGRLSDMSLIVRHLGESRRVLAASPAYLAARGEPRTLDDLLSHDCIVYRYLATGNEWPFTGPAGPVSVRVNGSFSTNSSEAVRAAVLSGMGIAMAPFWMIGDALASGALKAILTEYLAPATDISALYPPTPHLAPKVRVFIDFLRRALRRSAAQWTA
jgi:DNA-binding transcriptional LysR family regulator